MKKLAAFSGALLLVLVLAAPAAADQRVYAWQAEPFDFEEPVAIAGGWGFECSGTIYYGSFGTQDLWLWYPADLDEADMMPVDAPWPWIRGQAVRTGTDYFSSRPDVGGKVASGRFKLIGQLSDHYIGLPESWTEHQRGKNWGIQIPGYGTVFHESGTWTQRTTIVDPSADWVAETLREFRGNSTFDVEELCAFFGYDAVFP
jgi:hypothetical protein